LLPSPSSYSENPFSFLHLLERGLLNNSFFSKEAATKVTSPLDFPLFPQRLAAPPLLAAMRSFQWFPAPTRGNVRVDTLYSLLFISFPDWSFCLIWPVGQTLYPLPSQIRVLYFSFGLGSRTHFDFPESNWSFFPGTIPNRFPFPIQFPASVVTELLCRIGRFRIPSLISLDSVPPSFSLTLRGNVQSSKKRLRESFSEYDLCFFVLPDKILFPCSTLL